MRRLEKLTVILICILLLSSCQPTPEELVVKSKADENFDELVKQTPLPREEIISPGTETEEIEQTFTTSEFDYTFKSKDGDVDINVKAQVDMLEDAHCHVVKITHKEFPIGFVERACNILLEGQEMYEPRKGQTKDEIEAEILNLQAAIANPEQSHSDGLRSGDPETVAYVTKMFEDRIEIYKELLEEAPETIERIPVTFRFMPKKYYTKQAHYQEIVARYSGEEDDEQAFQVLDEYENEMQFVADADLSRGYYGRVEVRNYTSKWLNSSVFRFYKNMELNLATYGPSMNGREYNGKEDEIQMTEEEAVEYAESLIKDMGIENMSLSEIRANTSPKGYYDEATKQYIEIPQNEWITYGYTFFFTRTFGSLSAILEEVYFEGSDPEYGPRYGRETLAFLIDKDGVSRFSWNNQPKIVEVENDNVAILRLDEIMEIFNRQMALEYNVIGLFDYDEGEDNYQELLDSIESGRIDIDSIDLKMIRMPVKNQMGIYRMIPVWVFKGTSFFYREGGTKYEEVSDRLEEKCFLFINAIDGTIIN